MTGDRSDLHAILGLSSQATQGEIRRAYRTLMRHNHPDTRALGDHAETDATNTIARQVIAAYAVLGDPARRAVYDRSATHQPSKNRVTVRPEWRSPQSTPDQSPIQAGPVRWYGIRARRAGR
jgi:DnaJ-class molecular chaperone